MCGMCYAEILYSYSYFSILTHSSYCCWLRIPCSCKESRIDRSYASRNSWLIAPSSCHSSNSGLFTIPFPPFQELMRAAAEICLPFFRVRSPAWQRYASYFLARSRHRTFMACFPEKGMPRRSFTCVKPVFLLIASTKSIASVDGDFNMW
mgnify:CR=1 FL=1